jgi:cell division protein FtsB
MVTGVCAVKWFAASLIAALLLLQYRIWFSGAGVGEVFRLRSAVAAQEADNQQLSARNRQLAAEVRDLKQGYAALEERARTDLGMIGRNETFFQVASGSVAAAAPVPDGGAAPTAPVSPIAPADADSPATHTAAR